MWLPQSSERIQNRIEEEINIYYVKQSYVKKIYQKNVLLKYKFVSKSNNIPVVYLNNYELVLKF